jgi:hypothetical protein
VPSISAVKPYGGLETAPRPVTILGSGFDGATEVTFGGVRAPSFRVAGPQQITVTPPAYSSATVCAPLPSTGAYVGEDAGNDICQVHVAVVNPHGSSHAGQILAPPEGPQSTNALGDTRLGRGCGCEGVTAPDEYDYVPAPRITSVSTSGSGVTLASERGTTLITVRGLGLNPLALDWATFGDPARSVSQDTHYAYLSGTEMQIVAPAHGTTVTTRSVRLGVRTLGGQSPSAHAVYAGVPQVQRVVTVDDHARLAGVSGAPDVGGTEVEILGSGFSRQLSGPIVFTAPHGVSAGTEYSYQVAGGSRLVTATVAQTPGLVDVSVCTVSGCSPPGHSGRLWLYAPGDPSVTAVTPGTGPAAGGTRTEIQGANLGCPLAVYFGDRPARKVRPGTGVLDCGATQLADAVSPPGAPGSAVPVSVATVESYFTRSGRGTSTGRFSYTG